MRRAPFLVILIAVLSMSAGSRLAKGLATGLGVVCAVGALAGGWWAFVPSPRRAWEDVAAPPVPPPPLTESLDRIGAWLGEHHQPAARSLRPGLRAADVKRGLRFVPGYAPRELAALYQWHDGQDESFEEFIPGFRFLSLDAALRERRRLAAALLALGPVALVAPSWDRRWLPVLAFQDHYWVAAMGTRPSETATLFEAALEEPEPLRVQSSLAGFMAEAAACFESGAFFIDDEGQLSEDRFAVRAVRRRGEPSLPPLETWPDSLPASVEALPQGFRVETRTAPNGLRFTRRFDNAGRLLEYAESDPRSGTRRRTTAAYDGAGRILERRYESGGATSRVVWTYGSDGSVVILHQFDGGWRRTHAVRGQDQGLRVLTVTRGPA
jgi:cell wall assembly regulator SMI1